MVLEVIFSDYNKFLKLLMIHVNFLFEIAGPAIQTLVLSENIWFREFSLLEDQKMLL